MRKYSLIASITCFVFISCISHYSHETEQALCLAGRNRTELEKVLKHYGKDPADKLRLRAAEFLIANMPGHVSINNSIMEEFTHRIGPLWRSGLSKKEIYSQIEKIASEMRYLIVLVPDEQNISADYLIHNIELAFEMWHNQTWAEHLDFDEFCEFILPYKIFEGQPLDYWRDSLRLKYEAFPSKYKNCNFINHFNILKARDIIKMMREQMVPYFTERNFLLYSAGLIDKTPQYDCDDTALLTLAVMRSKGLPIAMDYTPHWSSRSLGHTWNSIIMNDGRLRDFPGLGDAGDLHCFEERWAKIYRHTYQKNQNIVKLHRKGRHIPQEFSSVFIQDVTSQYLNTSNVKIPIEFEKKMGDKFGYLSVFDNTAWQPLAYGQRKGSYISFEDIAKNHIYLPVFSTHLGDVHFNYPFKVDYMGNVNFLVPDFSDTFEFTFNRKYPIRLWVHDPALCLVGGKIEAANQQDFSDAVLVYEHAEWLSENAIRTDTLSPYRYWRFYSADNGYVNISEMMFMNINDSTKCVKGKIIGTEGSEAMFDGDLLTAFFAPHPNHCWGGMDFGEPMHFSKIIYYPRTDGNNIELGDTYELYYWGKQGWTSLGKQVAKDIRLTFGNIPTGALYLLDNITKGQEKRIFTIENSRQIWW